jgi:HEAT repeat protein
VRWRRRPDIRRLARKHDARRLVRALGYHDYLTDRLGRVYDLGASVRRDAALALAQTADTDGIDVESALIDALQDQASEVRGAAASALGTRGDRRAVAPLAQASVTWTGPRQGAARAAAVNALAQFPGGQTTAALVTTIVEGSGELEPAKDILGWVIASRNGDGSGPALAAASHALIGGDAAAAERAADILLWLGADGVEPLIGALSQPTARPFAIRALGGSRDVRATHALVGLLSDQDADTRRGAATALGETSDPRAAGPLMQATADPDYGVRVAALQAAQRLGPSRIVSDIANGDGAAGRPSSLRRP